MNKTFMFLVVATALTIGYVAGAVMAEGDKLDRAILRVHQEMSTEISAGHPFRLAGSDIKIWPIKDRPKAVRAKISKPLIVAGAGSEGMTRVWEK